MELEHTGSNKDNKLNVGNPNCGSDELAVRQHSACNAIKNKEGSNFAAKDMIERSVQNDTAGGGEQQHSVVFSDRSDSGKKGHLSSQNSCESKNCANQVLLAEMPAEGVNSTHDIRKDKDASDKLMDDAIYKLRGYFAKWGDKNKTDIFNTFDFKKFAEINGIEVDKQYIPHSVNVENNFERIFDVACDLLEYGLTIGKEKRVDGENGKPKSTPITDGDVTIKLTPEEVLDACKRVDEYTPSEKEIKYIKDNKLNYTEYKSYKLYGELGNIIFDQLNTFVQKEYFDKNTEAMMTMSSVDESLYRHILLLPLSNYAKGMGLCTKIFNLMLQRYNDKIKIVFPKTDCVNNAAEFRKLGIFFACKSQKLADKILKAAKFATSVGMKMPLFMAEFSGKQDEKITLGMSNTKSGILLNVSNIWEQPRTLKSKYGSKLDIKIEEANLTFYHEITHHARSAELVMDNDIAIAGENLKGEELKFRDDVIDNIIDQIREYALTDYEEYIAEFAAVVLCCLEQDKNPFDYITDTTLWRLYYEFGGPDFAPIIKKRKFLPSGYGKGCDILLNKECDWCSGYPSKFGINLDACKNKKIYVEPYKFEDLVIDITNETILPPPPLGYCYTTDNGKLQLKVDERKLPDSEDNEYYTPRFVQLTDGPLTLYDVREESLEHRQILKHHFELLPFSNNYAIYKLYDYFSEWDDKDKDFKFNKFNFKKFAEINGIKVDEQFISHSANVENNFELILDVADKLLTDGLTIDQEKRVDGENGEPTFTSITDGDVTIKLTPEEVIDACKRVEEYASSDEAKKYINDNGLNDAEYKSYKLYGELGNIIFDQLNEFVQEEYFDKNTEAMMTMSNVDAVWYRQILSLPLSNCAKGMELCTKIFDLMLHRYNGNIEIVNPKQVLSLLASMIMPRNLEN